MAAFLAREVDYAPGRRSYDNADLDDVVLLITNNLGAI